jgi:hypothetical protein
MKAKALLLQPCRQLLPSNALSRMRARSASVRAGFIAAALVLAACGNDPSPAATGGAGGAAAGGRSGSGGDSGAGGANAGGRSGNGGNGGPVSGGGGGANGGGSGSSPDAGTATDVGGSTSGVSVDQLALATATALCGRLQACCRDVPDPSTCVALFTLGSAQGIADLKAAIAAGQVVYDAAKARDCVAGLAATSCEAFRAADIDSSFCREATHGTVTTGGACLADESCTDGFCDVRSATPKCTALLADGQACTSGGMCESGHCAGPIGGPRKCVSSAAPVCQAP